MRIKSSYTSSHWTLVVLPDDMSVVDDGAGCWDELGLQLLVEACGKRSGVVGLLLLPRSEASMTFVVVGFV